MKRVLSIFLSFVMLLPMMLTAHAADWFSLTKVDNGIISVSYSDVMAGKLVYSIYRDGELVNIGQTEVQGHTESEVGLPSNKLPIDEYEVTVAYYNGANAKVAEESIVLTLGVSSPTPSSNNVNGTYLSANPIDTMKAIMVPYAKVYANASLTGTPVAELKRHDLVRIHSITNGIAAISYQIQSGDGYITKDDDTNATYHGTNDLSGNGYINASAFEVQPVTYDMDQQREAVELAYTRLGTRGVYSQNKRYLDFYLDCAALVCWCWHQVGVNIYNGSYTSCNGIASWAESKTGSDNVILWASTEDYLGAAMDIASNKCSGGPYGGDGTITSFDAPNTFPESKVVNYIDDISRDVWDKLEPGDIIFFNHIEKDLEHTHTDSDDDDSWSHTSKFGNHFVNEDGPGLGYDHVAMFVGYSSDGKGGENKDVITIIETSTPSTEANENTKVNTISFTSARTKTIRMVVRPTGCERIDPVGIMDADYSGTYYADIGDLQSPVAGLNASTKSNITGGSRFGYRIHPITGKYKLHTGVDLSGNVGAHAGSDVMAAADGEVVFVSNTCPHDNRGAMCGCGGGYGNYIIVQHSDTTRTLYAHLQQGVNVSAGQVVHAGDVIGHIGSSGSSTGPHLHFEVRYNNVPTDPLQYIN